MIPHPTVPTVYTLHEQEAPVVVKCLVRMHFRTYHHSQKAACLHCLSSMGLGQSVDHARGPSVARVDLQQLRDV